MFRKQVVVCATILSAFLLGAAVGGDENSVRKAFQSKFPSSTIEGVARTPVAGIYEVIADGRFFYTDEKAAFAFTGNLIDLRSSEPKNLTAEREAQLASKVSQVAAQILPQSQAQAIKRVKGNGNRVIYTFEDPNCGYCRELQKELNKITNVTIYTYLWAVPIGADSVDKSKAIWCSKDRARSWEETVTSGAMPSGRRDCDAPIEQNRLLAKRLRLRGTPAVFLANGEQVGGYLPADRLEVALGATR